MNHLTTEQLHDYIDGNTEVTSRNEIEMHLRACSECKKNVGELKRLNAAIRQMPLERVSEDFTERVMKELGLKE